MSETKKPETGSGTTRPSSSGKVVVSEQGETKTSASGVPRRAKAFTEPAPTHDTPDPCVFCGARDGQAHGRACPEAAAWVEAERAWRQEHE